MIIGIDVSPLYSGHKVRGIGFYTKRLLKEIKKLRNLEILELKTKNEIGRADYDLLHIPYFNPYFFTLPFKKKRPLVVTIHDLIPVKYPEHYPPGVKGRLRWQIQKRLLKRADAIITDSLASKRDIVDLTGYPEDQIRVVYLAAGEEFKKLEIRNCPPADEAGKLEILKKYQLPEKFVLYVGDVNWNKNIPGLVKACEKIKTPLVIVGKQAINESVDPNHPENKDLIWLQNYYRKHRLLILLGFIPTEDLVAIYNLATVYCQPSFDEGFGLPVIEAMACGCPVVASNRGSLPEVVGKAAILVKPRAEDLAEAIKSLLQSKKKRKELISLGLKRANEFSWQKTAQQVKEIYQSLV